MARGACCLLPWPLYSLIINPLHVGTLLLTCRNWHLHQFVLWIEIA